MAKREKKPEPLDPPKDLGAALFLELMMQMLAFFILLTSMAVIVEEKRLAALGSLAGTFSALPKGANLAQGKGPALPTRDIVEGAQAPKRTAKALTEVAKRLGLDGAMTALPLDKDKVRVRLPEWIVFAPGQVNLSPSAAPLPDRPPPPPPARPAGAHLPPPRGHRNPHRRPYRRYAGELASVSLELGTLRRAGDERVPRTGQARRAARADDRRRHGGQTSRARQAGALAPRGDRASVPPGDGQARTRRQGRQAGAFAASSGGRAGGRLRWRARRNGRSNTSPTPKHG